MRTIKIFRLLTKAEKLRYNRGLRGVARMPRRVWGVYREERRHFSMYFMSIVSRARVSPVRSSSFCNRRNDSNWILETEGRQRNQTDLFEQVEESLPPLEQVGQVLPVLSLRVQHVVKELSPQLRG